MTKMRTRRLYLDTCLLIAVYREADPHHKNAINFFEKIKDVKNTYLVCSPFTITEFTQTCVKNNYFSEGETYEISNRLLMTHKIDKKYPFKILSAKGKYTFEDFFLDLQSIILETSPRPHLADTIHVAFMRNNKIRRIVTYNKEDFEKIAEIKPYEPDEILSRYQNPPLNS
jgi:predicted nucleic acid-binding protein